MTISPHPKIEYHWPQVNPYEAVSQVGMEQGCVGS